MSGNAARDMDNTWEHICTKPKIVNDLTLNNEHMSTFLNKRQQSDDLYDSFVCKLYISIKIRNFGTTFETYLIKV